MKVGAMTELELLEAAAKGAGIEVHRGDQWQSDMLFRAVPRPNSPLVANVEWNPLYDDGDALRLAVALRMTVRHDDADACTAGWYGNQAAPTTDGRGPWFWKEWNSGDASASTRRAIVKAAAKMAGY